MDYITKATFGSNKRLLAYYDFSGLSGRSMGDNLDDFSAVFKHQNTDNKQLLVDSFSHEFGDRFIVLPNAMYGDWEFSMYGFESKTDEERRKIREGHIIDFKEL